MSQSFVVSLKSLGGKLTLVLGIILVAINLRPALAGIGPLIQEIREATGLSNSALGLLTTIPLIAFGTISILAPFVANRFGLGKTLLGAMLLLCGGIALRTVDLISMLYLGTAMAGIAIAFGNVVLPSLAKQNFSQESGLITSLYSSAMGLGAAIATGTAIPLADAVGWRLSLGFWTLPAMLAALVWLPLLPRLATSAVQTRTAATLKSLFRNRLAWYMSLFLGFQSLSFYVILAWLPAILHHSGIDDETAGWLASLCQVMGMVGSLVIPVIATRKQSQCGVIVCLILSEMVGLAGLCFFASSATVLWIVLIGFTTGGAFSLALLFLVLRSGDAIITSGLSGMAQSVGYLIAAAGPVIFAAIFDFTGAWRYPLVFLLGISVLKLTTGFQSAKDRTLTG